MTPRLVVVLLSLRASLVFAGGEWEESPEEKQAQATDRKWAKEGAAAIPSMVKALCGENFWLAEAAQRRLQKLGSAAAAPLLSSPTCDRELSPSHVLAALACDENTGASTRRLLLQGLRSNDRRRRSALSALSATECLDGDAAKPFVGPVSEALERGGQEEQFFAVRAAARLGPQARSMAPTLVELISRGGSVGLEAIDAVVALNVSDPPVVAALRARLNGTDEERKRAFRALGGLAVGDDRKAVLGDASSLLERKGNDCALSHDAAIEALGDLSDADPDRAARALLQTEQRLSGCSSFPLSAMLEAARHLPPPNGLQLLSAMLHDDALPVHARFRVVSELRERQMLKREDEELARAIFAQSSPWNRPEPQIQIPVPRADRLRDYLNACRAAGGKPAVTAVTMSGDDKAPEAFTACLQVRLCGPDEKRYRETIAACCETAFGKSPPMWCQP